VRVLPSTFTDWTFLKFMLRKSVSSVNFLRVFVREHCCQGQASLFPRSASSVPTLSRRRTADAGHDGGRKSLRRNRWAGAEWGDYVVKSCA
jgi:hypothetical protein